MVDPDRPNGEIPPELEELLVDGSQKTTIEELLSSDLPGWRTETTMPGDVNEMKKLIAKSLLIVAALGPAMLPEERERTEGLLFRLGIVPGAMPVLTKEQRQELKSVLGEILRATTERAEAWKSWLEAQG